MLSEAALERWKGFNEARFAVALLGSRKCPG
jgi:hypothetical protein